MSGLPSPLVSSTSTLLPDSLHSWWSRPFEPAPEGSLASPTAELFWPPQAKTTSGTAASTTTVSRVEVICAGGTIRCPVGRGQGGLFRQRSRRPRRLVVSSRPFALLEHVCSHMVSVAVVTPKVAT